MSWRLENLLQADVLVTWNQHIKICTMYKYCVHVNTNTWNMLWVLIVSREHVSNYDRLEKLFFIIWRTKKLEEVQERLQFVWDLIIFSVVPYWCVNES